MHSMHSTHSMQLSPFCFDFVIAIWSPASLFLVDGLILGNQAMVKIQKLKMASRRGLSSRSLTPMSLIVDHFWPIPSKKKKQKHTRVHRWLLIHIWLSAWPDSLAAHFSLLSLLSCFFHKASPTSPTNTRNQSINHLACPIVIFAARLALDPKRDLTYTALTAC
jgi:hypothetical protein